MFQQSTVFTSYSQAGQDVFAYFICRTDTGTFLDIGASNPVSGNNSYGLELKGWTGIAIDNCPDYAELYAGVRKTPLTVLDMTTVDWDDFISKHPIVHRTIDYLSFDIDEASLPVLRKFPLDRIRFRTMTVEHDVYRLGDHLQKEMRAILHSAGYELLAADVMVYYLWHQCPQAVALNGYLPFEDWYVNPSLVDMNAANKFRANRKLWNEILSANLRRSKNAWSLR